MGLKTGANKMDQVKIRKALAKDIPVEVIAKALKIELSVIKAYAKPEEVEPESADIADDFE